MTYSKPELKVLGSVADLTRTGNSLGGYRDPSVQGVDLKNGSRPSNGR